MEQMAQVKNSYEGMFLLDAGQSNTDAALEPVRTVLERSQAEILSLKTWDERRLAYEIEGRKRGLYVLSYFKLDADKVVELERDCMLSEKILRSLVLRKETVTEGELTAPTPAETAPAESRGEDDDVRADDEIVEDTDVSVDEEDSLE
jgi:small subunit ribosomal protein S6